MGNYADGEVLRYAGTNGEFPGIVMGPSRLVVATPYLVTRADGTVLVDATVGAFTVNLPSAVGIRGRRFSIVKTDAGASAVTLTANGAETINGAATLALSTQWAGATIESDGANWVAATSSGSGGSSTSQTQSTTTIVAGQSPYAALAADWTIRADATAGLITVTLPAAAGASGRVLNIKKIDVTANTVTIDANGAETIDGALTQVLSTQYASLMLQSNGAGWDIL